MTVGRKTTYGKYLTTARKVPEAGIKSSPVKTRLDGAGRLQQSCGIDRAQGAPSTPRQDRASATVVALEL